METPDAHPCDDERCAMFLTESGDPYVCLHYPDDAGAIDYWGRVARGELTVDDVIDQYREFLDFDAAAATSLSDHFDSETSEWTGPSVDIEVRVDNEPVRTFTAYPHAGGGMFPGFDTALTRAAGYMDGYYEAVCGDAGSDHDPNTYADNH